MKSTTTKTRELPQAGGTYKRSPAGALKQVEAGTEDALPYHLRKSAEASAAKPAAKKPAPKSKPAKSTKVGRPAKSKASGAATAAVAQNTTGSDTAGGAAN